jgi:hypothetical protein
MTIDFLKLTGDIPESVTSLFMFSIVSEIKKPLQCDINTRVYTPNASHAT